MMIINIDVDGVLAHMIPILTEKAREKYNPEFSRTQFTEYNPQLTETTHLSDMIEEHLCIDWYKKAPLMPGAKQSVTRIFENHTVNIVTHREEWAEDVTATWLQENNIPYDNLFVDAPDNKTEITCDYLIDDNPHVINLSSESVETILFPRPYNNARTKEENAWSDIETRIL